MLRQREKEYMASHHFPRTSSDMGMVRQMMIVALSFFLFPFNLVLFNLMFASGVIWCMWRHIVIVTKFAINEMTYVTELVRCASGNV